MLLLFCLSCTGELAGAQSFPMTLTDSIGRSVTLDSPVNRVVCTATQHLETLRSIKVSRDVLVGVPGLRGYSYFSEFQDITNIGQYFEPDLDKIVELEPDLVIFHPGPGPLGDSLAPKIDVLENSGINVICLYCNRPDLYADEVKILGQIFGREEEADLFIDFYEGVIDSIADETDSLSRADRPLVYSEWRPYTTFNLDSYPIEMAGGSYIFSGQDVRDVDPEDISSSNPDVILVLLSSADYDGLRASDLSDLERAREDIMSRPELQEVTAVQEGRVYVMTSPLWVYLPYSSCRYFIGIAYLAKWFHPQLFPDLDPEEIHQEYLTEFQGLDMDLQDRGVYVYPREEAD
ncbi:MAG: ABC transporter substrate-binding protein [Methanosarcinales archaeon]|nr:ABC transporter substrate-binding protein [Methanosarcinales archaeon]